MNRSKKKEKAVVVDITEKVLKYWYIDTGIMKIKHVDDYEGKKKLVSFDPQVGRVIDEDGKSIKVYTTFREASINLYGLEIAAKREEWKMHVDVSMKLNEEICDLLDKLEKLRDDGE